MVNQVNLWLMDHGDAPIRYRVARELMHDNEASIKLEKELLENTIVRKWLEKLSLEEVNPKGGIEHGAADFFLENALPKLVALGLHAGINQFNKALKAPIKKMENLKNFDCYFGVVKNSSCQYRKGELFPAILTANFLAQAGFLTDSVINFLTGSLSEIYQFITTNNSEFYLNEDERKKLRNIPPIWKNNLYFINPKITIQYGFSYPLIYDMCGLYQLYKQENQDINMKLNKVMEYIATDQFHSYFTDGYGTLIEENRTYHAMGWDPKYPGWFDLESYMNGKEASRALNYALYLSKYPIASNSLWMDKLLSIIEKYHSDNDTYIFPQYWLRECSGNVVMGRHMSLGQNRRKKDWIEIESTFYVQLLKENMLQSNEDNRK